MKTYNKLIIIVMAFMLAGIIGVNMAMAGRTDETGREYMVDIERAEGEINKQKDINPEKYEFIKNIEKSSEITDDFLSGSNYDYVIRKIDNVYYRFDYIRDKDTEKVIVYVNIIMVWAVLAVFVILLFVRQSVLKPFNRLINVPYELAKGNLSIPLKENKSRFFGNFVWGLDLLREKLENQKKEELNLQKEKKTLILSISHDIKTPLSSIKLYSKALSKGLYESEDKKQEVYG